MKTTTHLRISLTTLAVLTVLTVAGLAGFGPFAATWLAPFFAFASWGVLEVAFSDVFRPRESFVFAGSAKIEQHEEVQTERLAA